MIQNLKGLHGYSEKKLATYAICADHLVISYKMYKKIL